MPTVHFCIFYQFICKETKTKFTNICKGRNLLNRSDKTQQIEVKLNSLFSERWELERIGYLGSRH